MVVAESVLAEEFVSYRPFEMVLMGDEPGERDFEADEDVAAAEDDANDVDDATDEGQQNLLMRIDVVMTSVRG